VDEEKVWDNPGDSALQEKLANQSKAWAGEYGARLQAVNPSNGERLAEYELEALPVFDGMICAGNRIYAALADGKVICFRGK
jgi:hypothetical protein